MHQAINETMDNIITQIKLRDGKAIDCIFSLKIHILYPGYTICAEIHRTN